MADTVDLSFWEKQLLKTIRETVPKEHRKIVRQAGNLLRRKVRIITPRVTGELRRSYRVRVKGDTATVYSNKFYARFVEEGHAGPNGQGFISGKHYLRKSLEETEGELPELLKDFVRRMGRELGMDVSE
ncbi:MAG: hypothetical protein A4E53_02357 [Pelotomaculum sp. PtaB.Bin104]|nr:MAG: hypothetical protein A4E53_02357 [Pelotomaculum sp. PtaB.Bin104]